MARQLAAMSYTYTSWPCSPAIVVTQFTSTRPAMEGSSGADKSHIVVESVVAKSESQTGLLTIMAEWRQLTAGKAS
jgi:glycerol-3-phosphate dehydrogenase